MDDALFELEDELKRLSPRAPSARVFGRIEAGLAGVESPAARFKVVPQRPVSWLRFGWGVGAAAAVVAVAALVTFSRRPAPGRDAVVAPSKVAITPVMAPTSTLNPSETSLPTPAELPEDRYQPVGASSVLYDLKEEHPVNSLTHAPIRRLRYRYVDTYTWRNPSTNASLKWSVPRDEVRVLPASLH